MQVADSLGDKPRWDAVKLLLDAAAKDIAKLGAKWNVTAYQFDEDIKKLDLQDGKIKLSRKCRRRRIGDRCGDYGCTRSRVEQTCPGTLLLSDGRSVRRRRAMCHRRWPCRRLAAENIPLYTSRSANRVAASEPI